MFSGEGALLQAAHGHSPPPTRAMRNTAEPCEPAPSLFPRYFTMRSIPRTSRVDVLPTLYHLNGASVLHGIPAPFSFV